MDNLKVLENRAIRLSGLLREMKEQKIILENSAKAGNDVADAIGKLDDSIDKNMSDIQATIDSITQIKELREAEESENESQA